MPTIIDLAKALNGKSARKASTAGGNASGVRYGTATAATDKTVTVKLDGSDETVTLTTDAAVTAGNRVRVVSQGGSYAVVALEGIATASADAATAKEQAASASTAAGAAKAAADEAKSAADAAKADASAVKTTVKEVSNSLDSFKTTVADTYTTNTALATTLKEYSTVTQTAEAVAAKFSQAVTSVATQYAVGSSSTTAPTSGWSTATPTWEDGKYVWQRTVTTVNGKQAVGNATCIQGAKGADGAAGAQGEKGEKGDKGDTGATGAAGATGAKGDTGAAGKGIKTATPQYYLSTSKTSATGGSWATAPQAYAAGRYYWTRTAYTWTTTTGTTYSTAVYDPSLTDALAGVTELETLVRATSDGLEVAKMSGGEYVGARAVLDNDSLDFKSADGETTYASFGTDEVLLGMGSTSANVWLCKYSGSTGSKDTKGSFLLNKQSDGCHLYSDGLLTISPALIGTDAGWLSVGIGETSIAGDSQRVYLQGATGTKACMANILHVSSSYSAGYKVIYSTDLDKDQATASDSQTYRSVALRLSGWVVVALNNYVCPTAAPSNYVVGTLPAGWRPPMMMKGSLFAGSVEALGYDGYSKVYTDYAAMVNVTTAGQVRIYSPGLPANTKLSGYVIYPATK